MGYGNTINSNACRDQVERDAITYRNENEALIACLRLSACEGVTKYGETEFYPTKSCFVGVASTSYETYVKGNLPSSYNLNYFSKM